MTPRFVVRGCDRVAGEPKDKHQNNGDEGESGRKRNETTLFHR